MVLCCYIVFLILFYNSVIPYILIGAYNPTSLEEGSYYRVPPSLPRIHYTCIFGSHFWFLSCFWSILALVREMSLHFSWLMFYHNISMTNFITTNKHQRLLSLAHQAVERTIPFPRLFFLQPDVRRIILQITSGQVTIYLSAPDWSTASCAIEVLKLVFFKF